MNYAKIKTNDIANGLGVRVSLFVSGCTHHCHNCFNEIAWDFTYGKKFDEDTQNYLLDLLEPVHIKGLSLLGGEPMEIANQRGLYPFIMNVKEKYPEKDIWCYSGYTLEELLDENNSGCHCEITYELLSLFDILIDGKFIEEKKNISLAFRGSENQRIIDIKKTFQEGKIVELDLDRRTGKK